MGTALVEARSKIRPGMNALLCGLILLTLSSCTPPARTVSYQVVRTFPHDPEAYTQGLVFHDGFLYESTGRLGSSGIRKVDLATGEVLQETPLSDDHFGEGLALVGSELYQLTWHAGLAFVYDVESLSLQRTFEYDGEGWGLCFDGESLFMTNGTDRIVRRDPRTFEILGDVQVKENGISVWRVNELECVGEDIYANVYPSSRILQIEKRSGRVIAELDGYDLSVLADRATDPEAVLNGIARDPTRETLLVTGKLWDRLFEIRIDGG